jgi:hypothetical protein
MANRGNNGGVDLAMLTAAGRERGPDIVLNVEKTQFGAVPANAPVNGIITPDSSITEVLNIVAYLTIPTVSRAAPIPGAPALPLWYNDKHSVTPAAVGQYGVTDPATGFYTNALGPLDNSLFTSVGPIPGLILYDLNGMAADPVGAAGGGDFIPVCIRKRAAPAAGAIGAVADTAAPAANGNIPAGAAAVPLVNSLMSDCVKQMINILESTRAIFGPKGWTALFNQVKGGGGKNHAKRTHRQHRRRYSSKHY